MEPISPASESRAARAARSAVVVDELALVRLGLAGVLADAGPEGVVVAAGAAGGREGAELVRLHDADLAVVGSPADMPLLEAVRRARAASTRTLIVALLGTAHVDRVAAIVEVGADGVALRGGGPDELREAFATVLAGGRFVAPMLSTGLVGTLEASEPDAGERGHDLLTYREREVLALLAGGATNREIAASLSVTVATVKSHLVHLYAKLEVRNRQEALSRAVGLGLLA
ncbi:MAG TPA: response regulator transcription factor [Acidimicrobiia bacterium]|nr:response regulator transcription factor [Acidimicrobiia bacterium]